MKKRNESKRNGNVPEPSEILGTKKSFPLSLALVQLYLIADGKLHVGGGILLGHFHDLVPDVLGVLHELVVVVHIVVDNQEGPEQQNKIN